MTANLSPMSIDLACHRCGYDLHAQSQDANCSFMELTKWCIVLAIAIWLSIAQVLAWRQHKNANA